MSVLLTVNIVSHNPVREQVSSLSHTTHDFGNKFSQSNSQQPARYIHENYVYDCAALYNTEHSTEQFG